jgi:hypothetical protein
MNQRGGANNFQRQGLFPNELGRTMREVGLSPNAQKKANDSSFTHPHCIGLDTPLRLNRAVEIAFPEGGMTVSGLRREARRGRLSIEVIAGKQFTTLRAIEQMRDVCRAEARVPDCGFNQRNVTERDDSFTDPHGSSVMERAKSARAALHQSVKGRSKNSQNTSPKNTNQTEPAAVIPLKP